MLSNCKSRTMILLTLALAIALAVSGTASAQSYGRLAGIEIEGNKKLDAEYIKGLLPLTIGMDLTQEALDKAFAALQESGYFADLGARSQVFLGGIKLIVTVLEFPDLKAINIEGNTLMSDDELLSRMTSQVGKIINVNALKKDLDSIIQIYKDKGYVASIEPEIGMDGIVLVKMTEWKVGSILISGNDKTKEQIIRRSIKLAEGDFIDSKVITDDSRRIYNTGIFDEVGVELEPREEGAYADVKYVVKESQTGLFNVGATYNSTEGLIGYLEISDKNVFGYGIKVSGKLEAGGKEKLVTGEFSVSTPYLFTDKLEGGLEFYRRMSNKKIELPPDGEEGDVAYKQYRTGGSIWLGYNFDLYTKAGASFRLDFLQNSAETPDPAVPEDSSTRSITLSLTRDTRDDFISPTKGYTVYASSEFAGGILGGDDNFTKLYAQTTGYYEFKDGHVIAGRLGIGGGFPTLPEHAKYLLGGGTNMRGLKEPIAGDYIVFANAEYRFRIYQDIVGGVVFFDMGEAWNKGESFTWNGLKYGVGIGARVTIPMLGMLRLDYGISNGQGRVYFGFGHTF
ncbi:MAG TPA: BamA/TamA family outer membrane protein [Bacillota bacterium]|nr:BamA/TamA family outer membrane protein [Bacillota bacterium]HOH10198.1 BamA/TamA family outer membrane protein [Bacillota bacterium]HOS50850.1 BamA/TamA family outer membrane protein [Bacillota bacterium]HPI01160.1 BamA/TamA family outer membrane protein [Bacillota bacterium]HPM63587.1 BamA/TamA family outer membrane protein [Bacillota bacterium]